MASQLSGSHLIPLRQAARVGGARRPRLHRRDAAVERLPRHLRHRRAGRLRRRGRRRRRRRRAAAKPRAARRVRGRRRRLARLAVAKPAGRRRRRAARRAEDERAPPRALDARGGKLRLEGDLLPERRHLPRRRRLAHVLEAARRVVGDVRRLHRLRQLRQPRLGAARPHHRNVVGVGAQVLDAAERVEQRRLVRVPDVRQHAVEAVVPLDERLGLPRVLVDRVGREVAQHQERELVHVLVAVLEQPQHVAHRAALAQVLAERRGERALRLVDQRREVAERVELRLFVGRRDRGDEDVDGVGHLGREGGDVGHLRSRESRKIAVENQLPSQTWRHVTSAARRQPLAQFLSPCRTATTSSARTTASRSC